MSTPTFPDRILRGLVYLVLLTGVLHAGAQAFSFDTVEARAKALAAKPYQKSDAPALPDVLANLSYPLYRSIRYKPERELWQGSKLDYQVGFLIEGNAFRQPVKINEVDSTGVHPVTFDADAFDYGASHLNPGALKGAGFSGLRVRFPLDKKHGPQTVLEFQGASYFRAIGDGQVMGSSARGLAIDTGLISGEEFPRFKEFWVERPAAGDRELVIDALLDSKRATGAYRFVLTPGSSTVIAVQARIYLRDYVTKLGLAPIGSMFLFGENQPLRERGDYRPEVHDADGLQIQSGTGEWLWRPLVNPKRLLITSFSMTNPQGFGLMQRDRAFSDYQDLKHRYDLRPSVWVEPQGAWGSGRVELVEIPSPDETNNNVVAYWVPDEAPKPMQPLDLSYRVLWQKDKPVQPPASWVTQTRVGEDGSDPDAKGMGFVVDFNGPALDKLPPDAHITGVVSVDGNGEILSRNVQHNDATGGWRLTLRLRRVDDGKPVELRAYLRNEQNTVSETWSYILPPS